MANAWALCRLCHVHKTNHSSGRCVNCRRADDHEPDTPLGRGRWVREYRDRYEVHENMAPVYVIYKRGARS